MSITLIFYSILSSFIIFTDYRILTNNLHNIAKPEETYFLFEMDGLLFIDIVASYIKILYI